MNEKEGVKRGYLYDEFRLFHLRDDRGADTELHYHEFEKLVLVAEGSGSYTIEGRRYLLGPGDIVLVRDHAAHFTAFPAGRLYERIIFYISRDFLSSVRSERTDLLAVFGSQSSPVLRPGKAQVQRLLRLARECEEELKNPAFGADLLARAALIRLLTELERLKEEGEGEAVRPYPVRDDKILKLLRYLDEHAAEPLSAEALSERFYISKYHMMRRFKEETGTSIHQYLNARRLQLARDAIGAGMPAGEACFSCGFGSYSAFARAYVKYFGCPPGTSLGPAALVGLRE